MRISDWRSDVCSSDLFRRRRESSRRSQQRYIVHACCSLPRSDGHRLPVVQKIQEEEYRYECGRQRDQSELNCFVMTSKAEAIFLFRSHSSRKGNMFTHAAFHPKFSKISKKLNSALSGMSLTVCVDLGVRGSIP